MPSVTREIRIDAPPERVRRHVDDPARRRSWLDDPDLAPVPGDPSRFVRPDRDGEVVIDVLPDGDGSRVRVTETTARLTVVVPLGLRHDPADAPALLAA